MEDTIKRRMMKDMDKYDNEGTIIKKDIIDIFIKRDVSPIVAHMLLREIMEGIEKEDMAIKLANDVYKMYKEKEKNEK